MIIFIFQTILTGMDLSLTMVTLWLYLKELVKPNNPSLYYSLISCSFILASITFSGLIGYFVDRYRNVRLAFFTINTLAILGNLLYALPYSPWFLITGRLLTGIISPLRSVIVGEIARSFPCNELPNKMSHIGLAFAFGFVAGPASNLFFKNVEVTIMSWKITYVNMPGIYMAALFSVIQIMSWFMLSNLSKKYDMKMETMETVTSEDDNENIDFKANEADDTTPFLNRIKENTNFLGTLYKILSNFDTLLILLLSFLQNYITYSFDMWFSLLIVEKLKWSITAMNDIMLGQGLALMFPCALLMCLSVSNKFVYYIAVGGQIAFIFMEGITLVFFNYNQHFILNILLWVIFSCLYTFQIIVEEVFLVTTLAQMVSSRYQIFADVVRLTVFRMAAVTAMATSAMLFESINIVASIQICMIISGLVLLITRRDSLKDPSIIIK